MAISRKVSGAPSDAKGPLSSMLGAVAVQCLFLVMSLATGVLSARILGAEGRGIFAAITALPQLLSGLAGAGFGGAIIVMLRQSDSPESARIVSGNALQLGFLSSTIAAIVGMLLTPITLAGYSPEVILIGQWSMLGVFASTLLIIYRGGFAGTCAFNAMNLLGLMPQLVYLSALGIWIALRPLSAVQAALLFLGSSWLAVLLLTPTFAAGNRPILGRSSFIRLRAFQSYVFRALGYDLVLVISNSIDRLILIPFVPPAELGLYAVAVGFARLVAVVLPAINTVLLSSMSQRTDPLELKELHDRAFRFALAGLAVVVVVVVAISSWLLVLIYGPEFAAASSIFNVLVFEASLGCLVAITTQTYLAWNRPGVVSVIYGTSLAIFFAAAAALIPLLGAEGAAFALLAGTATRLLGLLACLPLRYGMALPRLTLDRADLSYVVSRVNAMRGR